MKDVAYKTICIVIGLVVIGVVLFTFPLWCLPYLIYKNKGGGSL